MAQVWFHMMKRLLAISLAVLVIVGCSREANVARGPSQFVYVQIPESIMPVEREGKYGDPLDAALKKAGVGEVTGGGSQMSAPDKEGKRAVEWVGLDVSLTDFDKGLPLLKSELLKLGAPSATVLEYERKGETHTERVK